MPLTSIILEVDIVANACFLLPLRFGFFFWNRSSSQYSLNVIASVMFMTINEVFSPVFLLAASTDDPISHRNQSGELLACTWPKCRLRRMDLVQNRNPALQHMKIASTASPSDSYID